MQKQLIMVEFQWQADAITHELGRRGIEATVTQKGREYASIISGITGNTIEISVEESDFIRAADIVGRMGDSAIATSRSAESYFKRVVVFSLISVILLPIVFNIVASANYTELKRVSSNPRQKAAAGVVLLTFWVFGLIEAAMILQSLKNW